MVTEASTSCNSFSFVIANGSSWLGTVWAPYAAINVGSSYGSSNLTGAFWSATQVKIQNNVTITFAPFSVQLQQTHLLFPAYVPPPSGKSTALIGPELNRFVKRIATA